MISQKDLYLLFGESSSLELSCSKPLCCSSGSLSLLLNVITVKGREQRMYSILLARRPLPSLSMKCLNESKRKVVGF